MTSEHHNNNMDTLSPSFSLPRNQKLYMQLADQLRQRIIDGVYPAGEMLPSETEMAKLYSVSRITVRQAILLLVEEGLVNRMQGKGTFVQALKVEQNFLGMHDFAKELRNQGHEPGFSILEYKLIQPEKHFQELFKLPAGASVHSVRRLKHCDGVPIMLERLVLPETLFPNFPVDQLSSRWISEILQQDYHCALRQVRKTLQPIAIGSEEARQLGIAARSLGLLMDRITWDKSVSASPIMVTRSVVPGEYSRFYVDLEYEQIKDHL